MFRHIKKIHFIGIGGIGMSGIAELLHNMGFEISGSDLKRTPITDRLKGIGIDVKIGHSPEYVRGKDLVVYSSAVKDDNIELREARALGIPCIPRAEMLGELMRLKESIAVTGTHGKTTTTSIIATIFDKAGLDPTIIVGGKLKSLRTNAKLGEGKFLICEVDESDKLFLNMTPVLSVITSIDDDHLDNYRDIDEIKDAFLQFANRVPFYGAVFLCADDRNVREIVSGIKRRYLTYGLSEDARVRGEILNTNFESVFEVWVNGDYLGKFRLRLPGIYNVQNALAGIAVALEVEIPVSVIRDAIDEFQGVERRFEIKGERKGVKVVDDYAHHPFEIENTLRTARMLAQGKVIAIFQPHLYSRTLKLKDKFGECFKYADYTIITKVYPAREKPIKGVTGKLIVDACKEKGYKNVEFIEDWDEIKKRIDEIAEPGDWLLTIGAGDIYKLSEEILKC